MALDFDAATGSAGTGSTNSKTFAHTCTGSDLLLLVGVGVDSSADRVSGITYNGVSMTRATNKSGSYNSVYIYYLINPSTGANNVIVSLNNAEYFGAGAVSFTGAGKSQQCTPITSAYGNSNTISISGTAKPSGSWLVDMVYTDLIARTLTVDVTQTQRFQIDDTQGKIGMSTEGPMSLPDFRVMSWSLDLADNWQSCGVIVRPKVLLGAVGGGVLPHIR